MFLGLNYYCDVYKIIIIHQNNIQNYKNQT